MRTAEKPVSLFMIVIRGALIGVLLSLLLLLLFSLALNLEWVQLKSLSMATLIIKIISGVAAAMIAIIQYKPRALITGSVTGASYAALAFLFFSIVSGRFMISWTILGDLGIGCACGAAAAIFLKILRS